MSYLRPDMPWLPPLPLKKEAEPDAKTEHKKPEPLKDRKQQKGPPAHMTGQVQPGFPGSGIKPK